MVLYGVTNKPPRSAGFSVVEIIIVITIIGILAGLVFATVSSYQYSGEDNERHSDVESLARAFETYYNNSIGPAGATYPSTVTATNTTNYPILLRGHGLEIAQAPGGKSATSLTAAINLDVPQSPTHQQYIYQPFTNNGALCTNSDANPCVRFTLYYRLRYEDRVISIESIHQQ